MQRCSAKSWHWARPGRLVIKLMAIYTTVPCYVPLCLHDILLYDSENLVFRVHCRCISQNNGIFEDQSHLVNLFTCASTFFIIKVRLTRPHKLSGMPVLSMEGLIVVPHLSFTCHLLQ